jgi:hypothetical protein
MASLLDNGGVGRARPTRAHQHRIAELCQITYYGAIALGEPERQKYALAIFSVTICK